MSWARGVPGSALFFWMYMTRQTTARTWQTKEYPLWPRPTKCIIFSDQWMWGIWTNLKRAWHQKQVGGLIVWIQWPVAHLHSIFKVEWCWFRFNISGHSCMEEEEEEGNDDYICDRFGSRTLWILSNDSNVIDDLHRDGLDIMWWRIFFLPCWNYAPETEVNVSSII